MSLIPLRRTANLLLLIIFIFSATLTGATHPNRGNQQYSTGIYSSAHAGSSIAPIFSYTGDYFCKNSGDIIFPIINTVPGGYFSTTSASLALNTITGSINLTASQTGTHTIFYNISTAGEGLTTTSSTININSQPENLIIDYGNTHFCLGGGTVRPVNVTTTPGGYFSTPNPNLIISNNETGEIDLNASQAGDFNIIYHASTPGCDMTTTFTGITINTPPALSLSYGPPACQGIGFILPTVTTFPGGYFSSNLFLIGLNNSTGEINKSFLTPGKYAIHYNISIAGCGTFGASSGLTIVGIPDVSFITGTQESLCYNALGNFTLSGVNPNIIWQFSHDNATWSTLANSNNTFIGINLSTTGFIRAAYGNSICPLLTTSSYPVTVSGESIGGIVGIDTPLPVCAGTTVGLSLSGYQGSIQWEVSGNGTVWSEVTLPGANLENFTSDLILSDIYFRAKVTNGPGCSPAYSEVVTITSSVCGISASIGSDPSNFTCLYNASSTGVRFTTDISGFADTIFWSFGEGAIPESTVTGINNAPSVIYTTPGIKAYSATITGPGGMTVANNSLNIENYTLEILAPSTVCSGFSAELTVTGIGNNQVFWYKLDDQGSGNLLSITGEATLRENITEDSYYQAKIITSACSFESSPELIRAIRAPIPESIITLFDPVICQGASTWFIANVNNGGNPPLLGWERNGSPAAAVGDTYFADNLQDGDIITLIVNSTAVCGAGLATTTSYVVTVTQFTDPFISITGDNFKFCSGSYLKFDAIASTTSPGNTFSWELNNTIVGTANSLILENLPKGQYELKVNLTASGGCFLTPFATDIKNLEIGVHDSLKVSLISVNNIYCKSQVATFVGISNAATPISWWINGEQMGQGSIFTTSGLNNYDRIVAQTTAQEGCFFNNKAESNVYIAQIVDPNDFEINVNKPQFICENNPVEYTAIPNYPSPANSFQWYLNGIPHSNTLKTTFSQLQNGDQIYVIVTAGGLCLNNITVASPVITANVLPYINPSISITLQRENICTIENISINAQTTGTGINPSINWYLNSKKLKETGADLFLNTLQPSDSIFAIVESAYGCPANPTAKSNSVSITKPYPLIASPLTFGGCANPRVGFVYLSGANTITLTGTTIDEPVIITNNGTFESGLLAHNTIPLFYLNDGIACNTLTITGQTINCPCAPEAYGITVSGEILGEDEVCQGETISYKIKKTGNWETVIWEIPASSKIIESDTGSVTLEFTGVPNIIDTIKVYSKNQCDSTNKITRVIKRNEDCNLRIPKAFTPADNENIVWEIQGIEKYAQASVKVYNRWGLLVYQKDQGYKNDWNGFYNGALLPAGTYYYVIDFKNGKKTKVGNVTILR